MQLRCLISGNPRSHLKSAVGLLRLLCVVLPHQAYQRAIARAVKRKQEEDGEAHCLDIGAGSGLLAVMAARAGASSVVACELHDGLAAVARRVRSGLACPSSARRTRYNLVYCSSQSIDRPRSFNRQSVISRKRRH